MISISCLESKLLNNNNWYGRFQLAPFQKGEGLTVANALRRTLLAEKSNFFITWVDFYNAEIPYSVLTGMRESIFDILLNLKQVIFTSDKIRPNRSHFLKSPRVNNFNTQKVKFLSASATPKKRLKIESTINFLDSEFASPVSPKLLQNTRGEGMKKFLKKDNFHIIPKDINNQNIQINQTLKNSKTNSASRDSGGNIFCRNQILDKMINTNYEVSSLIRLGIFNKNINRQNQFLDKSGYASPFTPSEGMGKYPNEKNVSHSTYIGYICAKGPTIIYAKNLKLPKGIKCVDPDKYIVTLADDGLFYLRFALTTEIQTLPSINTYNVSLSINQGIKVNKIRLKTFPKILFHKEMQSCSSFKIISSSENKKKKLNQQYFNNSQVQSWRSPSIASLSAKKQAKPHLCFLQKQIWANAPTAEAAEAFWPKNYNLPKYRDSERSFSSLKLTNFGLNSPKQKYPSFDQSIVITEKKKKFLSQIKLYHSKIQPVNHIKNLIKEQRLLVTNDSIKQLNFQNTSIITNIQKTCLLNIQIKHYYYKCGRFDRFLFDLIKPFKPTLKSTYYNEFYPALPDGGRKKKNLFYQSSNIKILTGFYKTFNGQLYGSQLFVNYRLFNFTARPFKKGKTSQLITSRVTTHMFSKSLQEHNYKKPASRPLKNVQINFLKSTIKKKHFINQRLSSFNPKNNSNSFFHTLPFSHDNVNLLKGYSLKKKLLLKWQKIFKSIKTSNIYDYLKKLSTSQARLICLLPIKPPIETRLSLNKKLISTSGPKHVLNTDTFVFSKIPENTKGFFSFVGTSSSRLKLHKPYLAAQSLKKFLILGLSFQCSQNNILWFLKSYIVQHTNSLNFSLRKMVGDKNFVYIKNPLLFPKPELTNRLFLEKQSQASTHHSRQNDGNILQEKPWSKTPLLELLFWINENQKPKHDYHLREFYYAKKHGSITKKTDFFYELNNLHKLTDSMAISGYMLSYNLFYKKPNPAFDLLINQPWINLSKSKWFNSVELSKSLRTKPITSIRQVSYKPVWILPFQHNTNLLRSWLNNINLPNSIHEKITKNQFLNISCLAKENMKKTFNSIPINSVILKPIYLHVSQITYILKQTTKFRKNQLVNPVFFNNFKKPAAQLFNNNKISLIDYYPKFSKVSNSLYNSLSEPCDLKTSQAPPHLPLEAKPWGESGTKPKIRLSFVNFYSLKNLNNTLDLCWSIKNTKSYKKQMSLATVLKKNSIYRAALSHIWIFDNNFVFKNHLSSITLMNQASSHLPVYAKPWEGTKSNSLYASPFFSVPLQFVSCFLKPSMDFINPLNKVKSRNLITIDDFSEMDITYKHPFFYKKTNLAFIYDNKQKIPALSPLKINDLYNEPYNINIYNSKISFNLRYTYPFKYTIFETFLPFQSMTNSSNDASPFTSKEIMRWDIMGKKIHREKTLMLMAQEKKNNKHLIDTEKYQKERSIFNETMDSYPHFDFIQYNESFKIYTSLAYTCLKTSDPHLPKYYTFNKLHKKSQAKSLKVAPFQISCFRSDKDLKHHRIFCANLFPLKKKFFEPEILDWKSFYKNKPCFNIWWGQKLFDQATLHRSSQSDGKIFDAKQWDKTQNKYLLEVAKRDKISKIFCRCATLFKYKSFSIKQIIIDKIISKLFTIYHDDNRFGLNNNSLPSIFDSTYKWRIMNNPNFNDAFIIIPCTWSLNFQTNALSLDASLNIINKFYSFVPPIQNFFMDYVSKNLTKILFPHHLAKQDFFCQPKEIIKNKLYWSRKSIITNKNNRITWIRPYRENSTKFRILSENHEQGTYNSKSSSVIPKAKLHRSFKKLAINFETSYYGNFLWNSRKITLRTLNNAVLPLVANRKYSISNFVPNKNDGIIAFINATMSKNFNPRPSREAGTDFSASFIYNNKQKSGFYFDRNKNIWSHKNFDNSAGARPLFKNKTINKITKNWLHQTDFINRLFEIYNYQKLQRFYSIRHKTLETTNFMCEKTYPTYINENQRQTILKPNFLVEQRVAQRAKKPLSSFLPFSSKQDKMGQTMKLDSTNEWQKQEFDGFSESSFSFLHDKLRPFFYGSLKHFQASSEVLHLTKPWERNREKDQVISSEYGQARSPFVHFATRKRKQSENNENDLLSYNQTTPEKLAYFRRRHWTERLTQGSKLSNESNSSSITDLKIKSPLNSNLWWSSFFCRYSLYAISTQSDLFLQNLINFSGSKNQTRDTLVLPQASSMVPLQTERWNETQSEKENTDIYDNWTSSNNQMKKSLSRYATDPIFLKKRPSQSKQNDRYQFFNVKPSIKSYEETMKKILKLQDSSLINYFVSGYNYNWQKAVHFTIFHHFKKKKSAARLLKDKKKIDSTHQNSIIGLKNYYSVRRLKNNSYYFGNPLRRRINQKSLSIYTIQSPTKLYKKITTRSSFLRHHIAKRGNKQPVVKSWKSIIWKAEANGYFCFKYPIFIQNCNLPWQKSKHIFGISKYWLNKMNLDLKPLFKWISLPPSSEVGFLSKTTNLNKEINTNFLMIYTQLATNSIKTHQYLLHTQPFNRLISSVHIDIQNQGSYGTVNYFTIKEGLNSIYKVNYIVESHVSESKPIYELESHNNQNNQFLDFGTNVERLQTIKKFETVQRDSTTTDSLTINNFLNSSYSFAPNKTIMLGSFNELINNSINKSQINHQDEYIQIDIWTNGEISPRQALLNAFKKLFELFYNLSKYNCLKPIEI